eukprot:14601372-Ditylum_brightwellii.AAC.1
MGPSGSRVLEAEIMLGMKLSTALNTKVFDLMSKEQQISVVQALLILKEMLSFPLMLGDPNNQCAQFLQIKYCDKETIMARASCYITVT